MINNFFFLLRIHQWSKNTILFVPAIFAHNIFTFDIFLNLSLIFVIFSLYASSVYIINDIVDYKKDKLHPLKSHRPIASNKISKLSGIIIFFILQIISLFLASLIGVELVLLLILYFLLTSLYTYIFKKFLIIDCFFLSSFYLYRIFIGGFTLNIDLSFWLIAFSFLFFLSLAYLKRYSEIKLVHKNVDTGRSYRAEDSNILLILGINSFYLSVLVLVFYINSPKLLDLYENYKYLWILVILYFVYGTKVWFYFYREVKNDDIVIFFLKDPTTYIFLVLSLVILIISI